MTSYSSLSVEDSRMARMNSTGNPPEPDTTPVERQLVDDIEQVFNNSVNPDVASDAVSDADMDAVDMLEAEGNISDCTSENQEKS